MIKKIKNMITSVKNKWSYRRIKKSIGTNLDKYFVDLGASSIKGSIGGELFSYRSSCRPILDKNTISFQKNVIQVNGEYYSIAESTTPTGNYNYKADKPNLNIIVIYGLMLASRKGIAVNKNIELSVLVPYTELSTYKKLQSKLEGTYHVKDLHGNSFNVNIVLNERLFTEGESSMQYFNYKYKSTGKNKVIVNMGYSTIDIMSTDVMDNVTAMESIPCGSDILLSKYLKHIEGCTSSSVLSTWMSQGFKFTKVQKRNIEEVNREYLSTIFNDIFSVLRNANPQNTDLILAGGTSLLLAQQIRNMVTGTYNLIVLDDTSAIFSDLLGMMLYEGENVDTTKGTTRTLKVEATAEGIKVDKPAKVPSSKAPNNKDKVIELKRQGLTLAEIAEATGLKYQTCKNYVSTYYKQELQLVN